MNTCIVCGDVALKFCRPHQAAFCKKHKALHEEGKQRDHIYEKLGQKLPAERIVKIVENLSSKIKIAEQCADQILKISSRLVETITNSCMRTLDVIKQKQRYYADLLKICNKRIFDDQLKEIEKTSRIQLIVNMPSHLNEIQNLYTLDFLKEVETRIYFFWKNGIQQTRTSLRFGSMI